MKHKHFLLIVISIVVFILSGQNIWAQVPQTMSYQGVLTSAKGRLVADGKYTITFKLYTAVEGGTALWSETQTVVVKNGLFNVALGSANALDVPFDKPYWLAITIGEGSEVSQRMQLTSSAYSLHARSVADSAITRSKIASGQVVRSINAITDEVTLAAGENVAITQEGNLLIISANLDQLSIEDSEDELAAAADLDKLSTGDIKPELKAQGPNKGKVIASKGDVEIVIDEDNDETDRTFSVRKDGESKKSEGTELFRVQEDGNVGIGTTDPIAPLHIANGALFLEDNLGDIWFKEVADLSAYVTAGSPSPTDPVFRVFTPPFGEEGLLMSVLANGNVGIGTEEPTEKLDVVGNIKAIGDIQTSGRVLASAYSSNSPLILEAPDFVERARIDDITGNFGIGTTSPTHRLHMVGGMFKVENDEPLVLFHKAGDVQRGWIGYPNFGAAGITIFNDISARELRLLDNGSLFYNGEVGIGTTSPIDRLDVDGNMSLSTTVPSPGISLSGPRSIIYYDNNGVTPSAKIQFDQSRFGNDAGNIALWTRAHGTEGGGSITERMRITSAGNVGIGTSDPDKTLELSSLTSDKGISLSRRTSSNFASEVYLSSVWFAASDDDSGFDGDAASIRARTEGGWTSTSHGTKLTFSTTPNSSTSSFERLVIDHNGNIGIGTTRPRAQLHTTGTVRFANFGAGTLQTDASGNVSVSSDIRLKNVTGGFERGLSEVLALKPINYTWKEETGFDTKNTYTGFSAQNVQDVIPEAVSTDQNDYLTLSDRPIIAALVNAAKELKSENEATKAESAELKAELESLKSRLAQLEETLQRFAAAKPAGKEETQTSAASVSEPR